MLHPYPTTAVTTGAVASPGYPPASSPVGGGANILWRSLRRHWLATTVTTVCLSATLIAVLSLIPPKYAAGATLMIETRPNVVNIPGVVPELSRDVEGLASEVEILRSRDIAAAVALRLNLTDIPGSAAPKTSPLSRLISGIDEMLAPVRGWLNPTSETTEDRVIRYLQTHEDVGPVGRSRVIEVRFTATSPQLARDVANAFVAAYMDRQVFEKTKASVSAKAWVDGEIERVRGQVQTSERKLADFRARSGLLDDNFRQLLPNAEIAELDRRLTTAEADSGALHARVDEVMRLSKDGSQLNAMPESIATPALQTMRQQEARLTMDLANLGQRFGPDSDAIRRVQAELAQLRQSIATELSRIARGLQSEAALSGSVVASLKATETAAKKNLEVSSGLGVTLASLQREVDAGRDLLMTLLRRQNELSSQVLLQTPDAHLISQAPLPNEPSFPKLLPLSLAAILGSAALAVGVGLLRDLKDRVIRSIDDLAAIQPYQSFGTLPLFQPARRDMPGLASDRSRYAEAVKGLYVQIAPSDRPLPRSVVITSALSGEGKTTTAVSLAMLAASLGRNVVLVDFDARRPSIHHILGLPLGPGLLDYLSGEVTTLNDVLQHPLPNLSVVTAGHGNDYNSILRADRAEALLTELAARFDQVIIDTPPCLAVVDSLVLARLADRVVHVVRWGHTRRESVIAATSLFEGIEPRHVGVVLSQVDTKRYAVEGYAGSAFYHRSLDRYYVG
ncbi:MAG TPA: polysaccharide biosynthesis tyrosine autokinase [Patescibacteria group bacterium]|nr:polysaccharide biosynthesis tyrosine autokinase [Patescibacteria group bacterium]